MRAQLEALVREMVDKGILYEDARKEFERRYITYALERGDGNIGRAAELIGLHRNTLSRKIAEYQIKRQR
jgi:Fis family transcriptional regulator